MRRFLAPLAIALASYACAPNNAAQVRAERSLTLGIPGAAYRPSGSVGVGITGSYTPEQKTTIDNTKSGLNSVVESGSDESPESQREVTATSYTLSPFIQYFPWASSAFFVGGGATFSRAYYKYDEETVDSTSLNPQYGEVNYETKAVYVGVPVGFAWIWAPGFSITLDVGPRARISYSSTVTRDGSGRDVSSAEREKTTSTIDSLEPRYTLGGSGMIGWSF